MTKRVFLIAVIALAVLVVVRTRDLIRSSMSGSSELALPTAPPPTIQLPTPPPVPVPASPIVGALERANAPFLGDSVGRLLERRFDRSTSPSTVNDYLLYLPPGLRVDDKRWPVILYLHGRSLRGHDLSMLERYGLPRYLAEGRELPFIVVAPQLPDGQSWTDVDRLAALIEDILTRYPADRSRVYLTGYSMGGGGVWRMAQAYADMFAAAAPLAALTPAHSGAWTRALTGLPLRVYHGTADEAAPFAGAAAMVGALQRDGVNAEIVSYEGADHGDLTRIYADPSLYDWFLAHRRDLRL
jgi:predicted peptidase